MAAADKHPAVQRVALSPTLEAWVRHNALALIGSALLLLALGIRLYQLGAQSLWLDEGNSWAEVVGRTGKGWGELIAELWSPDAAYPLYHLLLKGWVALAGDSEWALRFPSALAGALAVAALYWGAHQLTHSAPRAVVAALLLAGAPYAIWFSQDTKVYSLLILTISLLLGALLRAFERGRRGDWLLVLGLALLSLLVHRLALLSLAGVALAGAIVWPHISRRHPRLARSGRPRMALALLAIGLGALGVFGTALVVSGEEQSVTGHIRASPIEGVWLAFAHFSLERGNIDGYLGVPLQIWLLPSAVLTVWGSALLTRDALRGQPGAVLVLGMAFVPIALLAVSLWFTRLFEGRYAAMAYPAWVLLISYPLLSAPPTGPPLRRRAPLVLAVITLAINTIVLVQPQHGLFSGDPVKEQWREAIHDLAQRVHPDDLVILHPYYTWPMWAYYAPRVTPDPLPRPVIFNFFGEGDCAARYAGTPALVRECVKRHYKPYFDEQAYGKQRMLLLIAPDHARTVDPPKTREELIAETPPGQPLPASGDRYGWLGLRFLYPQRTWPCGGTGDRYIGVEIMCQSFPERYGTGETPEPAVTLEAVFGGELQLRGYSLPLAGDVARAGGTLPVTLYWQALTPPSHDYTMFLHLCDDCSVPPLAGSDSPPLNGYGEAGRTTTWRPNDPVHDERTVALPPDLPPGRYTLLLGVYPAGEPDPEARLQVESAGQVIGGTRLVLATVEITE